MAGVWKWVMVVIGVLALLLTAYLMYTRFVVNPRVADELRSNPQGARAARVMMLSLPDGREIPVNYLREGPLVFAGADGGWWQPLQGGVPVSMLIQGETLTGTATVVLDDPAYVEDVFSRLRPTVPEWLPDALNGKLVVITLDEGGRQSTQMQPEPVNP